MKKISLLILSLLTLTFSATNAQQVDRDKVILEIVTGTWCYYCPGAAMGADDLIANGKEVAVIEYHNGDDYTNSYGSSRQGYYGITGIPTAEFDGIVEVGGGNHTTSLYPTYLQKYNQRIAIPSSFTIDIEGGHTGFIDYEINITVTKVAAVSSTNLVLHFALTESEIMENWQGLDKLDYVERLMRPNQYGTALDFSSGDVNEVTVSFAMQPSWVNEHCEVVAFIQDPSTKEIFQGAKKDLMDFGSTTINDASVIAAYCPTSACSSTLAPKVQIANYGQDNLTSLDIAYHVNNDEEYTYQWTGNLAYYENEMVELPECTFEMMAGNSFIVEVSNPNGEEDEFPGNNTISTDFVEALEVSSPVVLALKLDDNPEETSWELLNSAGDVLYSEGGYTTPGQFVIKSFDLPQTDCYSFMIYDEGGDGLLGSGMWKLAYNGTEIFAQGKYFGMQEEAQFSILYTGIDEVSRTDITIYPNPVSNVAYVSFDLQGSETIDLNMYNSLGEIVYNISNEKLPEGNNILEINTSQFLNGIYYVNLNYGEKSYQEKIIVTK
ncbi:MAG: T9SS type A sorting domain-containing protein [Chlorobi bacterium]|nr:T9SS type A sorting domain-containing protein [Chlorobiota bacterium]